MGKKKSVTFEEPPAKIKKEKNVKFDSAERQKHINNLLETKKELENKIKMAHVKKKKSSVPEVVIPPMPLAEEVVCCVPLCTNTSFSTKNKGFFPFPANKKTSKQWVINVGRKGFEKKGAENLAKNYKVCSDHFEPTMFVPKTKHKVLSDIAVPTIFESIHEPEISIHTSTAKVVTKPTPPVKKPPKRNRTKKKVFLDDDFEYDDDIPLATLLPPKLSMKKKLIKKTDATNRTKWMYKPNVQIVEEIDKDACQSSGSEYEYEPTDEVEDEGDPSDENYNPAAKKRKMGSRKKPKEVLPLTMECYSDELSVAQKEAYAKATKIYEECKKKLDELAKMKNARLVFNDPDCAAYEIDDDVPTSEIEIEEQFPDMPVQKSVVTPIKKIPEKGGIAGSVPLRKLNTLQSFKPQESTSLGGLFSKVNKSSETGSTPDSKEVTFNKLAGKTYPSLVVIARPSLKLKDIPAATITSERTHLDAKVKAVLLYSSSNLTEWLIQQGLLRSEQCCSVHKNNDGTPLKLKLGMYSDVTKFPHSGGYVWISECCPNKFVSVFYNSIFEGAPHTPSVLVKLMYHWACQTSIGNVTSWVKIDNLYLKTFYSYMRCVCTAAVHEKHELIGGHMKKVEVGVISLGTTNVDGNLRQVKVEVLGVFETDTTKIRLRAIEPLPESERNQKKRFAKIMEPLKEWVHPDSAICTDFTVDKSAFLALGFKNVYQVSLNDTNPPQMNNKNIMEYLRRVVPRMFQNTLSLLSRHIIQQFLDELVWRERFGPIPSRAFESIVQHLAEQTKLDSGDTVLNRYQRISVNPFVNWQYSNWSQSGSMPSQESKVSYESKSPVETGPIVVSTVGEESDDAKRGRKRAADKSPVRPPPKKLLSSGSIPAPEGDEDISLETYYYGTLPGKKVTSPEVLAQKYSCPTCSQLFSNNLLLLVHLEIHSVIEDISDQPTPHMCRYCLKTFSSGAILNDHVDEAHLKKNIHCKCLICQEKCREKLTLMKHMQRSHNQAELPYVCEYCEFRCSEHKAVVDHFFDEHSKVPALQCPCCLKVVYIAKEGSPIDKNIEFFLTHLQRHQKKTSRKCNRCMLTFTNKMLIREHQLRDHGSYKDVDNLQHYPDSGLMFIKRPAVTSIIPIPKLKLQTFSIHYRLDRFDEDVRLAETSNDLKCHECEVDMRAEDHFPGVFTCMHCLFTTCCINAMHEHAKSFHAGKDPEYNISKPTILDTRMYCVCGFNSNSGNKLARHTAMCKKISVYPSEERADSAKVVVKGSTVLNILGLIRKDEEQSTSETKEDLVAPSKEGEKDVESETKSEEATTNKGAADKCDTATPETKTESTGIDKPDVVPSVEKNNKAESNDDAGKTIGVTKGVTESTSTEGVDKIDLKMSKVVRELEENKSLEKSSERVVTTSESDKDTLQSSSNTVHGGGENSNISFDDVVREGEISKNAESRKYSAARESEDLKESVETRDDIPKVVEEESLDDVISDSTSADHMNIPIEEEESLLNSGDDSNTTTLSKPNEGTEELPSDVDSNEVGKTKSESSSRTVPSLEKTGEIGSREGTALAEEDDDDAELIKQDMAALQQDLAALSGTCDIPLNTILDRQMEARPAPHLEVMETESPPLSASLPQTEEKMDEVQDMDTVMEVEPADVPTPPTNNMDCDSPNSRDTMLVE